MVVLWWGWSAIVQQREGGAWMPGSPLGGRWLRDPRSGGGFARNSRNTSLGAKLLLGSDAMSRLCAPWLTRTSAGWFKRQPLGRWLICKECGCQICVTCVCAFAGSIQQLPIMGHWGLLRGRKDDALSLYITGFSDNGFLESFSYEPGSEE